MQGRRVYPDRKGKLELQPGDYGKTTGGLWWVAPPRGSVKVVRADDVQEHPDGSITVRIPIKRHNWEGVLEHGVWREGRA